MISPKPTLLKLIIGWIVVVLINIPFVVMAVISFVSSSLGHVIIFSIFSVLSISGTAAILLIIAKKKRVFRFSVYSEGVMHTDVNATYFLSWADIASFGMVNNNVICGNRNTPPYQICLYFATELYNEKRLRSMLFGIENSFFMHRSSDEMIVLGFGENEISEELSLKINRYVRMHRSDIKEINYLSPKEIEPIYSSYGPKGCYATNRITADGKKVGYMYREEPDADSDFPDSGWRFFAGDETDEYSNNPDNINVFSLNTICNYDSDIIPYLDAPYGSAFVREGNKFIKD